MQALGANSYTASQGGFQFSQGLTQLNGGPAGNDYNAFASFLLGLPSNAGKVRQVPEEIQNRMRAYSFYMRDRWQVTPKLTLNYGLRWERFPFPRALHDPQAPSPIHPATTTQRNPDRSEVADDSAHFHGEQHPAAAYAIGHDEIDPVDARRVTWSRVGFGCRPGAGALGVNPRRTARFAPRRIG